MKIHKVMMFQLLSAAILISLGAYLFGLGLSNLALYTFTLALSNSGGTSSSQLQTQLQTIQNQFTVEVAGGVVFLALGTVVMQSSFFKILTIIQPSARNSISQPEPPRVSKLSTDELFAELRTRITQDERELKTKDESEMLHAYHRQLRARADEQAQFLVETGMATKQKRSSDE
jgi:hypothetical protein